MSGNQDDTHWHTIAGYLNVGSYIVDNFVQDNDVALDVVREAFDAMASSRRRIVETNRLGFTGNEYGAVLNGLQLSDEAQDAATRKELMAAINHCWRKGK